MGTRLSDRHATPHGDGPKHDERDPSEAATRCLRAIREGKVRSVGGREIAVRADSICVHSDTPNAVAIATSVRESLEDFLRN